VKGGAGRRPPPDARAALRSEIERAVALLEKRRLSDESVHGVRQALKRARAALRLLHDAVPEAAYARENAALRDAARPLASARDACVMLALVDEMIAARKMRPYRPVLVRLRAKLREAHARCMSAARADRALRSMRNRLEQSLERTAHWRLPRDARSVYLGGLRRIYERGQRELETARARGSASALHEWRKQVKYLGVAMDLLSGGKPRAAKPHRLAVEAARQLGDDHDLAALAAALRRMRADADLIAKLEQRRRKLQKRALRRGRRLFDPAPARFARSWGKG
jgi:hypothetical protein